MLTWKDFLALCRKTKLSIAKLNGALSSILAMKSMFPTGEMPCFQFKSTSELMESSKKATRIFKTPITVKRSCTISANIIFHYVSVSKDLDTTQKW